MDHHICPLLDRELGDCQTLLHSEPLKSRANSIERLEIKGQQHYQGNIRGCKMDNDNYNSDDDASLGSLGSVDSNDTLHRFIQFQSHRNESTHLEESISFCYPPKEKRITLSTLLQEDDLAPLFDGAGWAGTRLWAAAIWGTKYLIDHGSKRSKSDDNNAENSGSDEHNYIANITNKSLCELGCGLGFPGMIWHTFGGNTVLTEQDSIMSQLKTNIKSNFPESAAVINDDGEIQNLSQGNLENNNKNHQQPSIIAHPLNWSRNGFQQLLQSSGYTNGFDYVLNCDCVYEPLYGKSWELLVEVIDECLKVNPNCVVITSVERRNQDGIDTFVERMEQCEHAEEVKKVLDDPSRNLELYVTTGKC